MNLKTIKKPKLQPEFELQKTVCAYLCRQYPKTVFLSDARAFLKLTIPQAVRSKAVQKPDFACPDLIIFEARHNFGGLFFELKAECPYKRDGTLKKSDHLKSQADTITALNEKGYCAEFAWNFEEIKKKLDWYLR